MNNNKRTKDAIRESSRKLDQLMKKCSAEYVFKKYQNDEPLMRPELKQMNFGGDVTFLTPSTVELHGDFSKADLIEIAKNLI